MQARNPAAAAPPGFMNTTHSAYYYYGFYIKYINKRKNGNGKIWNGSKGI